MMVILQAKWPTQLLYDRYHASQDHRFSFRGISKNNEQYVRLIYLSKNVDFSNPEKIQKSNMQNYIYNYYKSTQEDKVIKHLITNKLTTIWRP